MTAIEQYARRHGRLHPALVSILDSAFFSRRVPIYSAANVAVAVRPRTWAPFLLSGRAGGPTPAFVVLQTLYVAEGLLNEVVPFRGTNADFATPEGVAFILHEAAHAYQHFRKGTVWLMGMYLKTMVSSWQRTRILWDHSASELEIEAGEWEAEMLRWAKLHPDVLEKFRELR